MKYNFVFAILCLLIVLVTSTISYEPIEGLSSTGVILFGIFVGIILAALAAATAGG